MHLSSCSPSSLSPLSSSMFLSVGLSSCGPQGCTWGQLVVVLLVACTAHDQSISISFARLAVRLVLFMFVLATHSLRLSGASIYRESCVGTCSERLLACGGWFWSSSRILRHTVECLRHYFWRNGSLSSDWCSWISKCLEARQRPGLPLKSIGSGLGSFLLHLRWWRP